MYNALIWKDKSGTLRTKATKQELIQRLSMLESLLHQMRLCDYYRDSARSYMDTANRMLRLGQKEHAEFLRDQARSEAGGYVSAREKLGRMLDTLHGKSAAPAAYTGYPPVFRDDGDVVCGRCEGSLGCNACGDMPDFCPSCGCRVDWNTEEKCL